MSLAFGSLFYYLKWGKWGSTEAWQKRVRENIKVEEKYRENIFFSISIRSEFISEKIVFETKYIELNCTSVYLCLVHDSIEIVDMPLLAYQFTIIFLLPKWKLQHCIDGQFANFLLVISRRLDHRLFMA